MLRIAKKNELEVMMTLLSHKIPVYLSAEFFYERKILYMFSLGFCFLRFI